MTKNSLTHFALGFAAILGMSASALAQSSNGTLHGTVVDPSGALIPGAQVTVSNGAGYTRTLTSGTKGTFELPSLAPGSYSVSINAAGFTPALEGGVKVVSARTTSENVKLGISVNQEIEVSAGEASDTAR